MPGRRWLRPLSIRTRLTLWYGALLLAILAGMGVLSYRVLAWSLVRDVDVSIRAVAEVIRATGQARTSFLINPAPEELLTAADLPPTARPPAATARLCR